MVPERVASFDEHPFCLPWVRDFDLTLSAAVTFVIGENGSGKTTLVEALAVLAGLPHPAEAATSVERITARKAIAPWPMRCDHVSASGLGTPTSFGASSSAHCASLLDSR